MTTMSNKLRWGYHLLSSELDLMTVEWLWREFYRTEDDEYALRIRSVLIAKDELEKGEK